MAESKYKERLHARGLSKTPRMKWTGLSAMQIQQAFDQLPHYKWVDRIMVNPDGSKYIYQVRVQVD